MAQPISIANAQLGFRNFSGLEGAYNREGDRNFVIFLDPEYATQLADEGWNVKFPKVDDEPQDPEDTFEKQPYLQVTVAFNKFPARVFTVVYDPQNPNANPEGYTTVQLNEDTVSILDTALIKNADLVINPYNWTVNGRSGIKAYLKNLYVELDDSGFVNKYGVI